MTFRVLIFACIAVALLCFYGTMGVLIASIAPLAVSVMFGGFCFAACGLSLLAIGWTIFA